MKKSKMARIILVVVLITTLLSPNLCLAMESAINSNTTESTQKLEEENTLVEEQDADKKEQNTVEEGNTVETENTATPTEVEATEKVIADGNFVSNFVRKNYGFAGEEFIKNIPKDPIA